MTDRGQFYALIVLSALVIGFVGAYALLYANTSSGTLALGSLLTIAGLIGNSFFQAHTQSFLGSQLGDQRRAFVAMAAASNGTTNGTTGSANSATAATAPPPMTPSSTNPSEAPR